MENNTTLVWNSRYKVPRIFFLSKSPLCLNLYIFKIEVIIHCYQFAFPTCRNWSTEKVSTFLEVTQHRGQRDWLGQQTWFHAARSFLPLSHTAAWVPSQHQLPRADLNVWCLDDHQDSLSFVSVVTVKNTASSPAQQGFIPWVSEAAAAQESASVCLGRREKAAPLLGFPFHLLIPIWGQFFSTSPSFFKQRLRKIKRKFTLRKRGGLTIEPALVCMEFPGENDASVWCPVCSQTHTSKRISAEASSSLPGGSSMLPRLWTIHLRQFSFFLYCPISSCDLIYWLN